MDSTVQNAVRGWQVGTEREKRTVQDSTVILAILLRNYRSCISRGIIRRDPYLFFKKKNKENGSYSPNFQSPPPILPVTAK